MYLDALSFLEDERDAFRPFEALDELTDDQLELPVESLHEWSGRNLMIHLLVWQEVLLAAAKELAVSESSPTLDRADADWAARADAVNDDLHAPWADRPTAELRARFQVVPGELRGYLTVVPESRWIKHATRLRSIVRKSLEHYDDHRSDLDAVLTASGR